MKLEAEAAEAVELEGFNKKFVSPNAGWKRLLSYYKPLWASLVMLLLALVNSV